MSNTHARKFAVLLSTVLLVMFCTISAPLRRAAAADSYDWSALLKKDASWYGSSEGTALADTILQYQHADGGWKKAMADDVSGSWGKSTTDNDATTSQITILARVYQQTGTEKYLTGCQKGLDLLLNGQYDNGGWPQVFNDAGTYHAHITYNDGAMVRVLNILQAVSNKTGDFAFADSTRAAKAKTAVEKGVQCILDTQILVNGTRTAWCQQHDEFTLAPAAARAYELPSISASESVGIVDFLKSLPNPSRAVQESIYYAVQWMTKSALYGIKVVSQNDDKVVVEDASAGPLWARFYNIDTNQPMFVDRDGSIHTQLSELSQERRTGYAWYGSWPSKLVTAGYELAVEEPTVLTGTLIASLQVNDTENGADWSIQKQLAVGNPIYVDRDFAFASLPDELLGAEWIRTACDSKSLTADAAVLTAAADLTVYVLVDTRVAQQPVWLNGWRALNTQATDNSNPALTFTVYCTDLAAGQTMTLGALGTSTGVVNYAAAVTTQLPEVVRGDLNGDSTVNKADYQLMIDYLLRRTTTISGAADMNSDGLVTVVDAALLKQCMLVD